MGEMSDPVGDAAAWARDGARHDNEKLEKRVAALEQTLRLVFEAVRKRMDMDTYAFDEWKKELTRRIDALERKP